MTIIDGLTGAYNKRYFAENLEKEIPRCTRHQRPLSLLMFDIDHFKRINDDHGHLTGDFVLREMARRVRTRVRKEEVFARYGGEEFVITLPEATADQATKVAEDVRKLVASDPFEFEGEKIAVTISVGVATTMEETPVDTFIKIADDNLYKAKRGGRNRVISSEAPKQP